MKKLLALAAIAALALPGCALLTETSEKAAKNAGKGIAEYCKLPKETRTQFRAMVAKEAAPHAVAITCSGD